MRSRAFRGSLDAGGRPASFLREGPMDGRPLVLLAHGAGAPMTSPFMEAVAHGLVDRGLAVCRFHFPYMEEAAATGRRKPPDREPVLLTTWRTMVDRALTWKKAGPIVLAGKSLGSRMATLLLARGSAPEARAGIWFGYPLHPPGKKDRLRDEHLSDVPVPQLFVSGSRDPLADLALLRPVLARIGSARLFVVEGGNHSLAKSRSAPLDGSDAWLDAAADFARSVFGDSLR